jgi:hypothetical protein
MMPNNQPLIRPRDPHHADRRDFYKLARHGAVAQATCSLSDYFTWVCSRTEPISIGNVSCSAGDGEASQCQLYAKL